MRGILDTAESAVEVRGNLGIADFAAEVVVSGMASSQEGLLG